MAIKVLIADDHGVVAEGLRHVIETQPDMQVIGCVANGSEAVHCATEARPDIVVMDYAMPVLNGTEATRVIRERCPEIGIVMLSMYSDPCYVARALQAGVAGYIVKKSAATEVVEAIRQVHAGRRYLSSQFTQGSIDRLIQEATHADPLTRLSSRERQVLQLLAEGHTNAEIASTLSITPKSVETYRARLEQKLGLRDIAGLVKFAIQNGVISIATQIAVELTQREREVLRWTALGKTSQEVAMILGVTTRTVTFHISQILIKLDTKNKLQAACKALTLHLLDLA